MPIAIWQVSLGGLKLLRANISRDTRDAGIVIALVREYIEELED